MYKYLKPNPTSAPKIGVENSEDFLLFNRTFKEFKLVDLDRDPFLGKQKTRIKKKNIKKQKKKRQKKQKRVRWPVVKYLGQIKKENGEKVALLNISGNFFKLKKGESTPNKRFSISRIFKDSVLLKSGSETKKIKK